jgi:hypothetical protein
VNLVILDTIDSLGAIGLGQGQRLDHGEELLVGGQLEHGQDLGARANVAGADAGAVGHELLGLELLDWLVGQADLVEAAVDLEDGKVVVEVERVRHVGRVEDKVELEGQGLGPPLVPGADKVLGAQLEGVVLLVRRVRDDGRLGAERGGPHDGKMAQSAEADNGDLLTRADACAHQWGPYGQTGAHHWRGQVRRNGVGNGEHKVLVGSNVRSVTTLRDGLIWVDLLGVWCSICV